MADDRKTAPPGAVWRPSALAAGLVGMAWVFGVLVAYYVYNAGYYQEKLGVFIEFVAGLAR